MDAETFRITVDRARLAGNDTPVRSILVSEQW